MESLFNCVETVCLTQGMDKTYWIAYSGGLDSHVLLHVCAKLRLQYPIAFKVAYVNHGLSPNANVWAKHCEAVCSTLAMDFIVKDIKVVANSGDSLEALARELRYKAFSECFSANDVLLTAHHLDDQAETVLLQLMRGAGPKGIAAMPSIKLFDKGFHARPFLHIPRKDFESYAQHHGLQWIEDESNQNMDFNRNYMRHVILPMIKKRWPSAADTLSRVARHCAETQGVVDVVMDDYLKSSKTGSGIAISTLLTLSPIIQRHVLRLWFSSLRFPIPSVVKMQQIQRALYAAEDKSPHIMWGHVELRRYQDVLYAMKRLLVHDQTKHYPWDFTQPLILPNVGVLQATLTQGQGLKTEIEHVTVKYRQGGEFCRLPGRDFHHDLKKLFQQWNIPPWERSRIPLLFIGEKLIAVVGYYIDAEYTARQGEQGRAIALSSRSQTFV
jgi:tRNA(Ile)-lysidine synthase